MNPAGSFAVGVVDFEWTKDGRKFASAEELVATEHLVGRLFYPSALTAKEARKKHSRAPWLPSYTYAVGYTTFMFVVASAKGCAPLLALALFRPLVYLLGRTTLLDNFLGAPILRDGTQLPLIIFSHGIGGMRTCYSALASTLAAQGYAVFVMEHADGLSSAAKLAGGAGFRIYGGWGTEARRMDQTRYRMAEVRTALKLLGEVSRGSAPKGLVLEPPVDPNTLEGVLDLGCAAVMGHSYGGATAAALCAEDPSFKCSIVLDPWWGALLEDSPALKGWQTSSPLLVLGSHAWNIPDERGEIRAVGPRQEALLKAATKTGAGAALLVLEGSTHDTFTDVISIFGPKYKRFTSLVGFTSRLEGTLGLRLTAASTLQFLDSHLPLSPAQRARARAAWPALVPKGTLADESPAVQDEDLAPPTATNSERHRALASRRRSADTDLLDDPQISAAAASARANGAADPSGAAAPKPSSMGAAGSGMVPVAADASPPAVATAANGGVGGTAEQGGNPTASRVPDAVNGANEPVGSRLGTFTGISSAPAAENGVQRKKGGGVAGNGIGPGDVKLTGAVDGDSQTEQRSGPKGIDADEIEGFRRLVGRYAFILRGPGSEAAVAPAGMPA